MNILRDLLYRILLLVPWYLTLSLVLMVLVISFPRKKTPPFLLLLIALSLIWPEIFSWSLSSLLASLFLGLLFLWTIYVLAYTWRSIEMYASSFLFFLPNIFILFSFLWGFLRGCLGSLTLEDLSWISFYRYSLLLSLIMALAFLYLGTLLGLFKKTWQRIKTPYLMEEMRRFLSSWEEQIFGPFFNKLTYQGKANPWPLSHRLLFSLAFYVIPLFQLSLILGALLWGGDLRPSLLFLPLSLVSWIYKALYHYFRHFLDQACEEIRSLVKIKILPRRRNLPRGNVLVLSRDKLTFTLSYVAKNKFTRKDLQWLIPLWERLAQCSSFFLEGDSLWLGKFLSWGIVFFRILSWFLFFYVLLCSWLLGSSPESLFYSLGFLLHIRSFSTSSFVVKKAHQRQLENLSQGDYKSSHLIFSDKVLVKTLKGIRCIPLQGQLTHGRGNPKNISRDLCQTLDIQGNPRAQMAVYPKGLIYFPKSWAKENADYSYYQTAEVQRNLHKFSPSYFNTYGDFLIWRKSGAKSSLSWQRKPIIYRKKNICPILGKKKGASFPPTKGARSSGKKDSFISTVTSSHSSSSQDSSLGS